jgi:hypothetical protein
MVGMERIFWGGHIMAWTRVRFCVVIQLWGLLALACGRGTVSTVGAAYNHMDCDIGTLAQTSRVLRDDTEVGSMEVHLSAARNEWESFQILLRSSKDIAQVDVIPGDLRESGGYVLSANTANLYRQHQIQLTNGSYGNTGFVPGWYPDALIPFRHPRTGEPLTGARFTATPFDLPAGQTHGFLVDLHVPRDASPGVYRGVYRLRDSSGNDAQIPVYLTVYDFTLPDTLALKTEFGGPTGLLKTYYVSKGLSDVTNDTAQWDAVYEQVSDLLSQNHIDGPPKSTPGPTGAGTSYVITDERIAALAQTIDQYHLNSVRAYDPRFVIAGIMADYETAINQKAAINPDITPEDEAELTAWLTAWHDALLKLNRPEVEFYLYFLDEPNDEYAYDYIQKWGKAIVDIQKDWKSSAGSSTVLKVLVTEQTKTSNASWGDLYGAVDIWVPLFPLHDTSTAVARQALGEDLWSYTALVQQTRAPTPWWETDFPLLNYRVASWISWVDQMKGLLYWSMFYWTAVDDPWTEPETYTVGNVYNGEGLLLYPARDVGYDGFVPSLRLKALRDSIEDYEYMSILERAGYRQDAANIVTTLTSSWTDWAKDPQAYEVARGELAHLIEQHQLSK